MTRDEFLAHCRSCSDNFEVPTEDEYTIIETVYTFHPSIKNVGGKEQIARLYTEFGMILIKDMLATANAAKDLEERIYFHRDEWARYQEKLDNLKAGK